jgi:hypothetical protein
VASVGGSGAALERQTDADSKRIMERIDFIYLLRTVVFV